MCLSKPQLVVEYSDGFATVEFLGNRKRVKSFMPLQKGDYVLSQANVVIQKLEHDKAIEMLEEWKKLNNWKQ